MNEHTQLVRDLTTLNFNDIVFHKPEVNEIKDQKGLTYMRQRLGLKNADGTIGDLVILSQPCFSFGPQVNTPPSGKPYHSLPLCMWGLNGGSSEEIAWVDTYNKLVEHLKKKLVENRDDIDKYDLELADLKKFNPMYYKRDKGKIVEDYAPRLYPKLLESHKNGVMTVFSDVNTEKDLDFEDVAKQKGTYQAAIWLESIYVGTKLSLQQKVTEVDVELQQKEKKRLLRPNAQPRNVSIPVKVEEPVEEPVEEQTVEETGDGNGSLGESDNEEDNESAEEEEPPPKPEPVKKKRVVRKKTSD